jgi:uncharacterized coiled-coil protein SlyX
MTEMATIDQLNAAILSLEGAVAQKNLEIASLRNQLEAAQSSTLSADLDQAVARITSAKNQVAAF